MNRETTCLLCGDTSNDVRPRLVAWKDGTGSEYQVIPRCSRTHECRARVLDAGEEWIVREPLDLAAIERSRVRDVMPLPSLEEALASGDAA